MTTDFAAAERRLDALCEQARDAATDIWRRWNRSRDGVLVVEADFVADPPHLQAFNVVQACVELGPLLPGLTTALCVDVPTDDFWMVVTAVDPEVDAPCVYKLYRLAYDPAPEEVEQRDQK